MVIGVCKQDERSCHFLMVLSLMFISYLNSCFKVLGLFGFFWFNMYARILGKCTIEHIPQTPIIIENAEVTTYMLFH